MPKTKTSSRKNSSGLPTGYHTFACRLCKRPHPLRTCRKFLAMNMTERIHAVRKHKYCSNCLAHEHSHGKCFSKHGCRHCSKYHHTLLHIHPRILENLTPSLSRSRSPSPNSHVSTSTTSIRSSFKQGPDTTKIGRKGSSMISNTSKSTTLSALLRQNSIILLPTVLIKIESTTSYARCLLDSGSSVSRISKKIVDELKLTTLTMENETLCPIVIKSRFDSTSKIEGIFRVDSRISLRTPIQSLPEAFKRNFRDLFLADPKFYESAGVDIILGVDVYPRVICEGIFTKQGLPTAQSTLFGWTIYGPCSM
ncbi:uncharacterized protein ACRADG_004954 [Cochliomyia hominivorax]